MAKESQEELRRFHQLLRESKCDVSEVESMLKTKQSLASLVQNESGESALTSAVANNHPHVLETLVAHGADLNAKNANGHTPVMMALTSNNAYVARRLVELGADPNVGIETTLPGSGTTLSVIYSFNGDAVNTGNSASDAQAVGNPTFSNAYPLHGCQAVYFNNPNNTSQLSRNHYTANAPPGNVPLSFSFCVNTDLRYYSTAFALCGPNYGIGFNSAVQTDINTDGTVTVALALPNSSRNGNWDWAVILRSSPVVKRNVWCHMAVTVSASYTASLYINGSLMGSGIGTGPFPSSLVTNMAFGTSADAGQRGFNGYLASFGLYYSELSAAEVKLLYHYKATLLANAELMSELKELHTNLQFPLYRACYFGDVDGLRGAMGDFDESADLNARFGSLQQTVLHVAASRGHVSMVQQLVGMGTRIDINATDKNGDSALLVATRCGNLDVAKALLQGPVDVNIKNQDGNLIVMALTSNNADMARRLVELGADPDVDSETTLPVPFFWYTFGEEFGDNQLVRNRGSGGSSYDATLRNGATTSKSLSRTGQGALILNSHSEQHLSIPAFTTGTSGISFACWFRTTTVDMFNRRIFDFANGPGVDNVVMAVPNHKLRVETNSGWRGVDWESKLRSKISDDLWRHIVWTLDPSGTTHLYVDGQLHASTETSSGKYYYPRAVSRTNNFIGKSNFDSDPYFNGAVDDFRYYDNVLSAAGVQELYNTVSIRGDSMSELKELHTNLQFPLYRACYFGDVDGSRGAMGDFDESADLNARFGSLQQTVLHVAASRGHVPMVQQLVGMGTRIDINATDKNGDSALLVATRCGNLDVAKALLQGPVDVNIKNQDGDTALLIAIGSESWVLAKVLIENKADIHYTNKTSSSAFESMTCKGSILLGVDFPFETLCAEHSALWFHIIQLEEVEGVAESVQYFVSRYPVLHKVKDKKGRLATEMATPANRSVIVQLFLVHKRYRITEMRPEHQSATCLVYRAVDEKDVDSNGNPRPVALKLMRKWNQFIRETSARSHMFEACYVIPILRTHPDITTLPPEYSEADVDSALLTSLSGIVPNYILEKCFCLVMPLADRNLFVAIKQERFAGYDMNEVCHVFMVLVLCICHMHSKNVVHSDLKPLNILRTDGQWCLVDLDAAAEIGVDTVGFKSSGAYVPPEAIYEDHSRQVAVVRSEDSRLRLGVQFDLLVAHPSFDVWSLGCIFFQLCTGTSLFKEVQDDNLSSDINDADSLWTLAEWSDKTKDQKLGHIANPYARNLASLMLSKDPSARPTLSRILDHPFLSGKKVERLAGEPASSDVFLSYRVSSDSDHVEMLYNLLTQRGLKVWWDKKCLAPGLPWKDGFCAGLVSSRTFVCLWSRNAINHPNVNRNNFSKLTEDSPCDNVLLELTLALELRSLGFIEKVFPVLIGDFDSASQCYGPYFETGCFPQCPSVSVKSVKADVQAHMSNQGLGSPLNPDITVREVMSQLSSCQGGFVLGDRDWAFAVIADTITAMVRSPSSEFVPAQSESEYLTAPSEDQIALLLQENTRVMGELVEKDETIARQNLENRRFLEELASKDQEVNSLRLALQESREENQQLKVTTEERKDDDPIVMGSRTHYCCSIN